MSKSKTKNDEVEITGKFTDVVGTPTILLLPARNYKFKVFEENFVITIPRKGKYVDFDGKMFSEGDGEFNLLQYDKSKKQHVVFLPSLTKILFATGQYPDLKDGHAFVPLAFVIKKDEVEIVGNVIEMVKES